MNRLVEEHNEAETLVNEFRVILMNEDTECGNEMLRTVIAKKMAKATINNQIKEVERFKIFSNLIAFPNNRIKRLKTILSEIDNT